MQRQREMQVLCTSLLLFVREIHKERRKNLAITPRSRFVHSQTLITRTRFHVCHNFSFYNIIHNYNHFEKYISNIHKIDFLKPQYSLLDKKSVGLYNFNLQVLEILLCSICVYIYITYGK